MIFMDNCVSSFRITKNFFHFLFYSLKMFLLLLNRIMSVIFKCFLPFSSWSPFLQFLLFLERQKSSSAFPVFLFLLMVGSFHVPNASGHVRDGQQGQQANVPGPKLTDISLHGKRKANESRQTTSWKDGRSGQTSLHQKEDDSTTNKAFGFERLLLIRKGSNIWDGQQRIQTSKPGGHRHEKLIRVVSLKNISMLASDNNPVPLETKVSIRETNAVKTDEINSHKTQISIPTKRRFHLVGAKKVSLVTKPKSIQPRATPIFGQQKSFINSKVTAYRFPPSTASSLATHHKELNLDKSGKVTKNILKPDFLFDPTNQQFKSYKPDHSFIPLGSILVSNSTKEVATHTRSSSNVDKTLPIMFPRITTKTPRFKLISKKSILNKNSTQKPVPDKIGQKNNFKKSKKIFAKTTRDRDDVTDQEGATWSPLSLTETGNTEKIQNNFYATKFPPLNESSIIDNNFDLLSVEQNQDKNLILTKKQKDLTLSSTERGRRVLEMVVSKDLVEEDTKLTMASSHSKEKTKKIKKKFAKNQQKNTKKRNEKKTFFRRPTTPMHGTLSSNVKQTISKRNKTIKPEISVYNEKVYFLTTSSPEINSPIKKSQKLIQTRSPPLNVDLFKTTRQDLINSNISKLKTTIKRRSVRPVVVMTPIPGHKNPFPALKSSRHQNRKKTRSKNQPFSKVHSVFDHDQMNGKIKSKEETSTTSLKNKTTKNPLSSQSQFLKENEQKPKWKPGSLLIENKDLSSIKTISKSSPIPTKTFAVFLPQGTENKTKLLNDFTTKEYEQEASRIFSQVSFLNGKKNINETKTIRPITQRLSSIMNNTSRSPWPFSGRIIRDENESKSSEILLMTDSTTESNLEKIKKEDFLKKKDFSTLVVNVQPGFSQIIRRLSQSTTKITTDQFLQKSTKSQLFLQSSNIISSFQPYSTTPSYQGDSFTISSHDQNGSLVPSQPSSFSPTRRTMDSFYSNKERSSQIKTIKQKAFTKELSTDTNVEQRNQHIWGSVSKNKRPNGFQASTEFPGIKTEFSGPTPRTDQQLLEKNHATKRISSVESTLTESITLASTQIGKADQKSIRLPSIQIPISLPSTLKPISSSFSPKNKPTTELPFQKWSTSFLFPSSNNGHKFSTPIPPSFEKTIDTIIPTLLQFRIPKETDAPPFQSTTKQTLMKTVTQKSQIPTKPTEQFPTRKNSPTRHMDKKPPQAPTRGTVNSTTSSSTEHREKSNKKPPQTPNTRTATAPSTTKAPSSKNREKSKKKPPQTPNTRTAPFTTKAPSSKNREKSKKKPPQTPNTRTAPSTTKAPSSKNREKSKKKPPQTPNTRTAPSTTKAPSSKNREKSKKKPPQTPNTSTVSSTTKTPSSKPKKSNEKTIKTHVEPRKKTIPTTPYFLYTSTLATAHIATIAKQRPSLNEDMSKSKSTKKLIVYPDESHPVFTVTPNFKQNQPKWPLPTDSNELLVKCKVKSYINVNGNDFLNQIKNGLVLSYLEGRHLLDQQQNLRNKHGTGGGGRDGTGSTNNRRKKREAIDYAIKQNIATSILHFDPSQLIKAKILRVSRQGKLVEIYFQMLENGFLIGTDTAIQVFLQLQITEISVHLHYPIYHPIEAIKHVMFQSQHPLKKPSATKWMMVTIAAPSIPVLCVICILLTSWYRNHARLRRKAMIEISRGSHYAESLADVGLEVDMEKGEIVSRAGSTSVLWTDFAAGDTLDRMDMTRDFPGADVQSSRSNSWNAHGDSRLGGKSSGQNQQSRSPVARQCQRSSGVSAAAAASGKYTKKKDSISSFNFDNNLQDECPSVYESFIPALKEMENWPRTSTLQSTKTRSKQQRCLSSPRKANAPTSQIYGDYSIISSQNLRPTLHANIISHFLAELDTM